MAEIAKRPTIHGDTTRALTVALPPTYDALMELVKTSFHMHASLKLYINGKYPLNLANYSSIGNGDTIIAVDSGGRAVDLKNLFKTTYDDAFGPKPLPPREESAAPAPYEPLKDNRDFHTTNDDFKKWPIPKREQFEPEPAPRRLPFRGTTEAQDQFKPKILPREERPAETPYERPRVPFTGTTTSQDAFKPWKIEKRPEPSAPEERKKCPFTARTTNQDSYKPYKIDPKERMEPEEWKPSPAKFQGRPTSQDYQAWPIAKKEQFEPEERPKPLPFTGRTTNQDDYRPYDVKPQDRQEPQGPYEPMRDNRDFKTTNDDFKKWPIERKDQFEPEPAPRSLPFTARSSNQDDYKPYDIRPSERQEPTTPYSPMRDNRDFKTTNDDFKKWPIPKKEEFEPEPAPRSLPFTARSTNQDDYKPYEIKPKKRQEATPYEGSKIPFTAKTTNQDNYKKWAIPRKIFISIVPANDAFVDKSGAVKGHYMDKKNSTKR